MESREVADPERQAGAGPRVRSWERWAGIAGLTFIVLDLVNRFTPGTPSPDLPPGQFAAQLAGDLTGIQLSIWLGFLGDAAFLLFLVGLWGRVRRFEGPGGLLATTFLVGEALSAAVLVVARGCYLALVQYGMTSDPEAASLTTLGVLAGWLGSAQLPAALVGMLALAVAIRTTGALPRWLGWLAAVDAVFILVSLAWNISTSTDGVLGVADTIGTWVSTVFFLAVSVLLLLPDGDRTRGG